MTTYERKRSRRRKHTSVAAPNRVLRIKAAQEKVGLRKWMFAQRRKNDPRFPKAVQLSKRAVGFLESELDAYIREVMSKERKPHAAAGQEGAQ